MGGTNPQTLWGLLCVANLTLILGKGLLEEVDCSQGNFCPAWCLVCLVWGEMAGMGCSLTFPMNDPKALLGLFQRATATGQRISFLQENNWNWLIDVLDLSCCSLLIASYIFPFPLCLAQSLEFLHQQIPWHREVPPLPGVLSSWEGGSIVPIRIFLQWPQGQLQKWCLQAHCWVVAVPCIGQSLLLSPQWKLGIHGLEKDGWGTPKPGKAMPWKLR